MRLKYRFFVLSLILAVMLSGFTLNSYVIKAAATETEQGTSSKLGLKSTEKILYIGGCKGASQSGKKAKFYESISAGKLIKGFSSKKYDITLKTSNAGVAAVDSRKDTISAKGLGNAVVTITVREKTKENSKGKKVFSGKLKVTVKQNADEYSFKVEGIMDGQTAYAGGRVTVNMPGDYTDFRDLLCDDEGIAIVKNTDGKSFEVYFDEPGDYTLTAAAYQSAKYNAYTVSRDFDITVKTKEAEVIQISSDSIKLVGEVVDEEMEAGDILIYENLDDIDIFFSYVSDISIDQNEAVITSFKPLNSEKDYVITYDGLSYYFRSQPSAPKDVESFKFIETNVRAGEESTLSFRYYNQNGLDITKSVAAFLDNKVKPELAQEDMLKAYFIGKKLCIPETGTEVEVKAHLEIEIDPGNDSVKLLEASEKIKALPPKGTVFTGKMLFTIKPEDDKYLSPLDEQINSVPLGDNVVFEALFEMEDGSYKTLKQAGITSLIVGDQEIVMLGSRTGLGGYELILNKEGTVGLVACKNDEPIGSCEITVLPKRKPAEMKVELSKDHLNTNMFTDDYILIKADLYDQYGKNIEAGEFTITQTELGEKTIGSINFNRISKGRFLINGWECPSTSEPTAIVATVECGSFSKEIKFYICDIKYDPKGEGYSYNLKIDGPKVIDTAVTLSNEPPQSTFISVEITKDGFFVSEGIGFRFKEAPSVLNRSGYYGVSDGESLYGIVVEHISEDGEKKIIGDETGCIIPAYMEMEFMPYSYREKLPAGTYDITVYHVTTGGEFSQIEECDTVSLKVLDTDPDIEVIQLKQTYLLRPDGGWINGIDEYFSFKLLGEDITEYITKVDCAESSSGTVFVKSVDFLIPNPYFGAFTKTVTVERLITKQ